MVLRDRFKKKTTVKVISRPVKIAYEPIVVKAIVILVKEQLNLLRAEHGLECLTNAQVLNAVKNKIRDLAAAKSRRPEWLDEITE